MSNNSGLKKYQVLDNFTLKIIATLTMLIDHVGHIFYTKLPYAMGPYFKLIGRISFPIFAFLLVEGFIHTRDRINYLGRLFVMGIGIEVIMMILNWTIGVETPVVLNIFITLGLGLIIIWWIDIYWDTSKLITTVGVIGMAMIADFMRVDYGAYGVLMITFFYIFRKTPWKNMLAFILLTLVSVSADIFVYTMHTYGDAATFMDGVATFTRIFEVGALSFNQVSFLNQIYSVLSVPILLMYNGKKGYGGLKYFFYAFYPLHFGILLLIRFYLYGN